MEWIPVLVHELTKLVVNGIFGVGWAIDDVSILFEVDDISYQLETEGSHLLITEGRDDTGIV